MNGGSNGSNVNSVKSLWCGVISNPDGRFEDLLLFFSSTPLHTVKYFQLECNMFLFMITYLLMQVTEVMISIQWFDRYNICGIARL